MQDSKEVWVLGPSRERTPEAMKQCLAGLHRLKDAGQISVQFSETGGATAVGPDGRELRPLQLFVHVLSQDAQVRNQLRLLGLEPRT
jgi:hypothetical protein